jgi:hypothetical protein
MGTVDRDCGAAQPRGGTLTAGAARPWHALTASLSIVVCCFVWLCIRQCHELILKTRAERSEGARARAVARVELAQARVAAAANQAGYALLAMTSHEIRAPLNPVLGLATTLLVIGLDVQPPMPVEAIAESGDNLLYLLNDTLDFSRLETGRVALEQRAFSPESLVDQTASLAGVWADQQAIGLWMGDFNGGGKVDIHWQNNNGQAAVWLMNGPSLIFGSDVGSNPGATSHAQAVGDFRSDDRADILWPDADGIPAISLLDGFNLQSGDNFGFNPAPAWQAHGAGDHNGGFSGDAKADTEWQNSDGTPATWLTDGFSLVSDNDVGFNPATDWHEVQQYYDLL